jgi:hypothetical protein
MDKCSHGQLVEASGFKGAREATPYAAQITSENAVGKAKTLHNVERAHVYVKGIGAGREQAVRGIWTQELISSLSTMSHQFHTTDAASERLESCNNKIETRYFLVRRILNH